MCLPRVPSVMYPPGHVGITVILFTPLTYRFFAARRDRAAVGWLSLAILLTLLPDVDVLLPGVVHRGVTHTLVAAVFLGAAVAVVGQASALSSPRVGAERTAVGFTVGAGAVVSHILGDVITPMGIRPLHPFWNAAYTFDFVQASDPSANTLLLLAGAVVFALTYRARDQTPDPEESATPAPSSTLRR